MATLADIARILGVQPPDDPRTANIPIRGIATLSEAAEGDLSFVATDAFLKQLAASRASAVVAHKTVHLPRLNIPVLVVDDAELAVSRILQSFAPPVRRPTPGVDPSARVAQSAHLAEQVSIAFGCFIGERARIGSRTILHPGVYVGDDAIVGDDCELHPNVVLRERVQIGNRVIINACSVLGTDGFGYRWDGTCHVKVPQIGTVIVDDDVEIGSCVCIDRAKFSATRIGRGTKIDSQVQIGHNVCVGEHCIIVGQSGIAGSSTLGKGVVLGGKTAVRDHIAIGEKAMAAACSAIADDVPPNTVVSGMPALPHRQSLREQGALRRLPDIVTQVRKLQERVQDLESKLSKSDNNQ